MPKNPHVEDRLRDERLAFLEEKGLSKSISKSIGGRFGLPTTLTDVETMRNSLDFFSDLGADVKRIYKDYPQLLTHHKESNLKPKLNFLVDEIGISRKTVAKLPELFTYSLNSMRNTYQHYLDKFSGNEKQAKALLRDATTVFGNSVNIIDDKIRKYREAGIDFHRNYTLLEISPTKAIDTRDYLTELGVREPETGKWYHMLLTLSRGLLEAKIEYCKRENINWRAKPKILVFGLGTDKKPGALLRRVNMIKNAFTDSAVPPKLDYKSDPLILDLPDRLLIKRIELYR